MNDEDAFDRREQSVDALFDGRVDGPG